MLSSAISARGAPVHGGAAPWRSSRAASTRRDDARCCAPPNASRAAPFRHQPAAPDAASALSSSSRPPQPRHVACRVTPKSVAGTRHRTHFAALHGPDMAPRKIGSRANRFRFWLVLARLVQPLHDPFSDTFRACTGPQHVVRPPIFVRISHSSVRAIASSSKRRSIDRIGCAALMIFDRTAPIASEEFELSRMMKCPLTHRRTDGHGQAS